MPKRVELHCHSLYSDGTLTPAELVARALKNGVEQLTLTDHDSVSGGPELFAAGKELGLDVRLGIEINCAGEGAADRVHVLGYGFDPKSPGFEARLAEFRERRTVRAKRIVENLRGLGFAIEFEHVASGVKETLGRPHVADALRRLGIVKSRKEAFERFLIKGKPGYVDSMGPSPREAIALIRDAGGVACLAHPQTAGKENELDELHRAGLQGIEVLYSGHTASQVRHYGDWARSKGLLAVGGSDFHGPGTGREEKLGIDYDDAAVGAVSEVLALMLVIAHRGASGHAPENTMAAFLRSLAMGAPAIELDVHQTLDHELVVAHDDDLKRCGRDKRRIKNVHWDDIAGLDVGSWFGKDFSGERLPRLEDVFDILPKNVELHVEIKRGSATYPGIEERVVDLIHKRGASARTLISSFDHAALYSVRSLDEKVRLGYLLGLTTMQTAFKEMKDIDAESLNISARQVTARIVKSAHDRGRKVLVYTVNTPAERDRLNAMGVDGIFCNYPELNLWR